jgi:bifunctional UDP-N-acetylglucosamine pyrophosphorylase / glucosamine-1-phosphate N-acetyltransferase
MSKNLNVVILAAGKGTRMVSALPKVLHQLAGRSLLQHSLDTALALESSSIQVVIGHESEQIKNSIDDDRVNFVLQEKQLGTGHAVHQALPHLDSDSIAMVLYGDVPLIKTETLQRLLSLVENNSMAVLCCEVEDPKGLGRIIRDNDGLIKAIVEEKDATVEQGQITEINTGMMVVPVEKLHDWLPRLSTENAQGEYLLTDLVELASRDGCKVFACSCDSQVETSGVNDRVQLAILERHYQDEQARKLLLSGVTLMDPRRLDIRGDLTAGQDVEIDINVIFEGKVKIQKQVKIGANCILKNCEIGEGSIIQPNTIIEDSRVGIDCQIGPFARIRPGTELGDEVKVGNFVETKKAIVSRNSKISHLSYIGDSEIGEAVNVGAGTITCNYDGVNKFQTIIGNNVFIGSNTALVAPLTISDGATIGAGSTITKDIAKDQLAVTRAKQHNVDGWNRPQKK